MKRGNNAGNSSPAPAHASKRRHVHKESADTVVGDDRKGKDGSDAAAAAPANRHNQLPRRSERLDEKQGTTAAVTLAEMARTSGDGPSSLLPGGRRNLTPPVQALLPLVTGAKGRRNLTPPVQALPAAPPVIAPAPRTRNRAGAPAVKPPSTFTSKAAPAARGRDKFALSPSHRTTRSPALRTGTSSPEDDRLVPVAKATPMEPEGSHTGPPRALNGSLVRAGRVQAFLVAATAAVTLAEWLGSLGAEPA